MEIKKAKTHSAPTNSINIISQRGTSVNKLSEVELRSLDLKLFDYQQIDRKIAIRKLEIQTETSNDCNVGGGKANTISKPTENVIARWSSDVRINGLEQLNFNPRTRVGCDLNRYFNNFTIQ